MKKPVIVILHTSYWCLYLVLLSVIALIIRTGAPGKLPGFSMVKFMTALAIIPAVAGFYTSYTFLFFEYLNRKRIPYLFVAGFAISCACSLAGIITLPFIYGPDLDASAPLVMTNDGRNLHSVAWIPLNAFINGLAGLMIKGFITWYDGLKQKEEMDKKNFEMELALVKSQFNPHFLFNTINNIDVLIDKDPATASGYLNQLSDIMRFMLYETKTEQILLEKELTYIGKYIDLQKIRTANPDYVLYSVKGNPDGVSIAPMLFIPFIENAFKHAVSVRTGNVIHIAIRITTEEIVFECANSYNAEAKGKPEYGGLGNELIQKRLALLYPGRYKLEVDNSNHIYQVKLAILNP